VNQESMSPSAAGALAANAGAADQAEATFLHGGGEMGERMRAKDWTRTPLGPVAEWPQSLKTAVRIMLTSRQAMFVWWGPELINLYNDAYKAIVGGKHPEALGQPASQLWREIWDQVGPRAESAIRNNEGTYDESLLLIMERNGYPEETYYTFSYSPVPNDDGTTAGSSAPTPTTPSASSASAGWRCCASWPPAPPTRGPSHPPAPSRRAVSRPTPGTCRSR
jgi:PAS domain-containing protein